MITISNKIRKLHPWLCDKVGRQVRKFTLNYIERHRLKNRDFSILSQNCVGSIWYHDLGLKFTSPTINMKFDGNDWVDFLCDFDNNINLPIHFIASEKPYPVGLFGGKYRVEFVHYHSEAEVIQKWEERKTRLLSRKAVLAFADDMDATHIRKFLSMDNYPNRLLFASDSIARSLNICSHPNVISVKTGLGGGKLLNFSSIYGQRHYARYIDYVRFLNNLK